MQCTKPISLIKQGNLSVPCGKCRACRIARARDWAVRIMHEFDYFDKAGFVTLTYDDNHLPENESLVKRDLQLFFKRLRKHYPPKTIKYFGCGEYGEHSGRPHYHAIIFGIDKSDFKQIEDAWSNGLIHIGTVSYDSARYVADYIQKKYSGDLAKAIYGNREPPFQVCSLGLGKKFAEDNRKYILENMNITMHGDSVGIPRYYKKILDIDAMNDDIVYAAQVRDAEVRNKHIERAGLLGIAQSISDSRTQAERNLEARLAQKKKGKM